jgi:hypothetical protein
MANVLAFSLVRFAVVIRVYTFFVHSTSGTLPLHTTFELWAIDWFVYLFLSV